MSLFSWFRKKNPNASPPGLPTIRARAYEAASTQPRVADWDQVTYGPNAALDCTQIARARSQDAIRNNPWLRKALKLLVSHLIGCGIQPRPKVPDPDIRATILDLWNDWTSEADADGVLDFAGLQSLLTRSRLESGEAFLRIRYRRTADGLTVPLQLQILEADLLPISHNVTERNIRQGIERNAIGQRLAYWFYREHPADRWLNPPDLARVPAVDILHHYRPERPGQLRGVPEGLSTLPRARNLDHYESAELTRKKNKARFSGAIWKDNPEDNPLTDSPANPVLSQLHADLAAIEASAEYVANDPAALATAASLREQIQTEQERKTFIDIEDGYMLQLGLNERIELFGGDTGNAGMIDFLRSQLRAIAAGWGVPYELMTGDYAETNDRIMRVILNTFYRQLEADQDHLISQILQPIYARWLTAAVLTGALRLPGYERNPRPWQRCEWRAHAWSYVNPLQEAETAVLKINNGLTSRSAAIAESGWDAEEVDRQQAEDRQREHDLGLQYGEKDPIPDEPVDPEESAPQIHPEATLKDAL